MPQLTENTLPGLEMKMSDRPKDGWMGSTYQEQIFRPIKSTLLDKSWDRSGTNFRALKYWGDWRWVEFCSYFIVFKTINPSFVLEFIRLSGLIWCHEVFVWIHYQGNRSLNYRTKAEYYLFFVTCSCLSSRTGQLTVIKMGTQRTFQRNNSISLSLTARTNDSAAVQVNIKFTALKNLPRLRCYVTSELNYVCSLLVVK